MSDLDKKRKERSVVRRLFSKTANELRAMKNEAGKSIEIETKYKTLQKMSENIQKLDETIKNLLLVEEDEEELLEKEMEAQYEYQAKWNQIEAIFTEKRNTISVQHSGNEKRSFKLPKLKMITFDGQLKSWLPFWGQFQKIDEDPSLDDTEKYQYLLQSMEDGTEVYFQVKSFPATAYKSCLDDLNRRYAREDLLIETYIREILSLVLMKNKIVSLTRLYDQLNAQLRALETLNVTKDKYAAFLLPMIESALPEEVLGAWERTRKVKKEASEDLKTRKVEKEASEHLNSLFDFLQREVESEQRLQIAKQTFSEVGNPAEEITPTEPATAQCLVVNMKKEKQKEKKSCCIWCEKDTHASIECYKLNRMTLEEKKTMIKEKKGCSICLRKGHHPKACRATVKCMICSKRHSTVLCPDQKTEKTEENKEKPASTSLSSLHQKGETLLQTVVINVRNGERVLPVRALFDNGSQRSYIREDVAKKLQLTPSGQEELGHCLFGNVKTKSESHDVYNVTVESLDSKFKMNVEALSRKTICGNIPTLNVNSDMCKILNRHQITLTDEKNCHEIGILIGADYTGSMLTSSIIMMENGLVAIKTKLGWTIQGKQLSTSSDNISTSMFCMSVSNDDLTDFWAFETLGIHDPAEMKTRAEGEAEAVSSFEETVQILPDGRYEVELPFKVGFDDLLPNYDKAEKRLDSNTKRLMSSGGRYNEYDAIFKEWLRLRIIEEVPSDDMHLNQNSGHYLPHKAVFKESSLTSKIRPVFDASCPDKNGLSLNACLEKGINYIDHIPKLLIGFRKRAIGITSDIAKAFLQISVQAEDRDYLKFLWWEDESLNKIVEYRHCRVVFGLTSSPFLLSATLMHHLEKISGKYRETAQLLKKSFYVDNCLTSLESEVETRKFIQESKHIMEAAKFDLRMWTTSPLQINEAGKDIISVLGMNWDTVADELSCNTDGLPPPSTIAKLTKRVVLSLTQKIFDPVGITCGVTLPPRLLLQEMWRRELTWDEPLPQDLAKEFLKWYGNIEYLKQCKIPRRLTAHNINDCNLSLHLFCDASKHAIAACIFLRAECNNKTTVRLVAAKSRVAPPKNVSIPRLELTAAVIGVRLLVETRKSLDLPNCSEYYWTDSSVTLYWICNNLTWNVFVGNRVKEIRDSTKIENWFHISGSSNWADLASRGCDAKQLLECRWPEGPQFLLHSPAEWPRSPVTADEAEVKKELKKTAKSNCNVNVSPTENFSDRLLYFSNYEKVVRVVAWMIRFADMCLKMKVSTVSKSITNEEYERAERKLILLLQRENKDELEQKCKNMHAIHEEDGLVRIKTRLLLSDDMPESTKCPILLPAKNEIIRRMVEQKHIRLHHAGTNTLIADIRKSYWILGIRRLVRSVISNCMICKRHSVKQMQAPVAPLPVDRIKSSVPFEVTGVDLAGPLFLKGGEKCWIVLYTCAVYRAVHLELTLSLSTEAFIRTLRRFIARRGRVRKMYSDNGANFLGTKNLLDSINWEEVQKRTCAEKIKWILNAPTGAWWGGFFERLIRTMKDLLRKVLGKASVTYDELHTLLCECESVMNNRPMTYVQSDNAESLEPLSPACFLQPLPNADTTDLDLLDSNSLNIRLKYLHKLRDDFRQRFRTEYLMELVQRGREKGRYEEIKEGQVVLLETEEKRINWPLAIVTRIYTGKDGVNRTAQVKTSIGFKVRPIQRLYPLEISSKEVDMLPTPKQPETVTGKPLKSPIAAPRIPVEDGNLNAEISPDLEKVTRHGRKIKIPSKYKL